MIKKLRQYRVLTFDCYGTLIDWESGIWDALQPAIAASGRDDITRAETLEIFAREESRQQSETPDMLYPELLARVHPATTRALGIDTTPQMDADFGASLPHWPAFPDTADALRILKKYFKLVILSNVNRDGFAASNRKLGVEFDAIYTAEDVGSYKPNPANFEFMLDQLRSDFGFGPEDILHTAQSLFHDHQQAAKFGLARAWIDRQKLSEGGNWGATARVSGVPDPDFLYFTMEEMAAAAEAESV